VYIEDGQQLVRYVRDLSGSAANAGKIFLEHIINFYGKIYW